jgi:hypothetical protein
MFFRIALPISVGLLGIFVGAAIGRLVARRTLGAIAGAVGGLVGTFFGLWFLEVLSDLSFRGPHGPGVGRSGALVFGCVAVIGTIGAFLGGFAGGAMCRRRKRPWA